MTRRFCQLALMVGLFAAMTLQQAAQGQTMVLGVPYRVYGQGYYGGYGQDYRYGRVYAPRVDSYTVYGNGPYGYGSGSQYQFPAPGFYQLPYIAPVYNPYGFSYGSSF